MAKDTTLGGTYFAGPVQSNDGFAFTATSTTPTSGAARLWKDASNDIYWWDGSSNEQVNGGGGPDLTEVVTAANVITAAETGSVFFLNSGTEFASTLPAPAAGLHFTFIVTAAPSGASYTIATNSSANIILGTVHSSTGGNADSELSGCDTITFADGVSVVGDTVELWCDGTNWFAKAFCDADAGITFDTAS